MKMEDEFTPAITDRIETPDLYSPAEMTRILHRLQEEVRLLEEYIFKATGKRGIMVAHCTGLKVEIMK